jgi:hypothetical protein
VPVRGPSGRTPGDRFGPDCPAPPASPVQPAHLRCGPDGRGEATGRSKVAAKPGRGGPEVVQAPPAGPSRQRPGMSSAHADLPRVAGIRLHRRSVAAECRSRAGQSGGVIVTALTPAGGLHEVGAGWRAADDITRSSRGRSHSCRHVRWGPAVLPHTRDRVALARRVGGERRSSRWFATRALALGACRDRRSRVSPARSLFSSQTTDYVVLPLGPRVSGPGETCCVAVPVLQVLHRGPSSTGTEPFGVCAGSSWRTFRIAPGQGSWSPHT